MNGTGPIDGATRTLLDELASWSEQRWFRRLDSAFARFVADLAPAVPAPVVMAAACVAHLEGKGHSCLRIDRLLEAPAELLGLPAAAQPALQRTMALLPKALGAWLALLRESVLVQTADADADIDAEADAGGGEPLVLCGERLYLRRYWRFEQRVAAEVRRRSEAQRAVDPAAVRHWLDRLFPAAPDATDVDWQKAACAVAVSGDLAIITGGPGTGKTFTAARLLALLFSIEPAPERLRIALAAPTGKAAARLRQAIADAMVQLQEALGSDVALSTWASTIGPARTVHALLGARPDTRRFGHDAAHPLEIDMLIVDEASMIHLEMMAALFDALPPRARVILLGDKDQLASVEAGAVLGDLCRDAEAGRYQPASAGRLAELTGHALPARFVDPGGPALAQRTVMLRSSRRFGGPIGQLAAAVNRGDLRMAQALLQAPPDESLRSISTPSPAALVRLAVSGYRDYLKCIRARPRAAADADIDAWIAQVLVAFDRFRVLCALREGAWGVGGLNPAIERALETAGLLARRGEWYEGRPVMATRNDAGLGIFNGDIGIVLRPPRAAASASAAARHADVQTTLADVDRAAPLRVYFPVGMGSHRSVAVSRLANAETAFAMTVHKAQGSEFEHTVLVLPDAPSRVVTRELVYTAITRARKSFTLVSGAPHVFGDALGQRTVRASGLAERLEVSK